MSDSSHSSVYVSWIRRFPDAILSNAFVIGPIVLFAVIPAVMWSFAESVREVIEGNSYRIESIDRYAAPSSTYTHLVGSDRRPTVGGGRVRPVFSGESPCSQRFPQTSMTPTDMGTLFGTMPPGLLATIRYTRRAATNTVSFTISSGHILFIAMQGDLPRRTCFNEKRDQVTIEYGPNDSSDIAPKERVLFIQTDEPAADIESKTLRDRTSAYFAVLSLLGVLVFVFFAGSLALIIRNGRHDQKFRNAFSEKHEHMSGRVGEANVKLDKLNLDVTELKKKQEILSQWNSHVMRDLENVAHNSYWIKENLKTSNIGPNLKSLRERQANFFQESKRKGTEDGEKRFSAEFAESATDNRRRSAQSGDQRTKSARPPAGDPRAQIREMKSDTVDFRSARDRSR